MSHSWGYKNAQKLGKEMGMSAGPVKVTVKTHTRMPRLKTEKPVITPPKPMTVKTTLAKGGKVKSC